MKYTKSLVLLLILISSFFIIDLAKDKNLDKISEITTSTILKIQAKATSIFLGLSVQIDDGAPKLFIESPLNKTYNYNNSIELNFTITENNLDTTYYNIDNGANTTITGNTTFSVNLTSTHTLILFANDTLGNLNSTSRTFSINISLPWNITFTEFTGQTTNFSALNKSQQASIQNVILENPEHGRINYNENIDIERSLSLDSFANISFNRIEIESEDINEFNKSATLRLYNLTFTNPRVLKDGSVCSSSVCPENSYSNGTFSFNITSFTVYSSEETPVSAPSGGSVASGGAGGGGGGGAALSNFDTNLDLIKVSLLQGETKRETIEIENTGTTTLNLLLEFENLEDFLIFQGGFNRYQLTLLPGEKQSLQLIFNVEEDYKPGIYIGRIIISSPQVTSIIPAIVEIESLKKIFDIDIKLQDKEIVGGNNLIAEIIIFNLGGDQERVDAQVKIGIKDLEGNIILEKDNRIAVETQASFTESLLIPKYLAEGRYVVYAEVRFDGQVGTVSEVFEVIDAPKGFLALSTFYIYIIPGFVSFVVIFMLLEYLRYHYKKKKFRKIKSLEEVIALIRNLRKEGYSNRQIRKGLQKRGWSKEQIKEIFRRL